MGKWFVEFFLVFLAYTATYTFTLGFTYPVQKIILPDNSLMASILFLPHGVRAIALFLFGFRAIVYLLPAQYAMWYISVHGADIGLDLFSPLVSVLGCLIGYLLFLGIRKVLPNDIYDKGWILVMIIIALTAIFNGIGLSRLHSPTGDFEYVLAYFWGDVLGGFIFLILAMYIWRILKNTKFH